MPSTQPYAPSFDFSTDPDPQNKVNAQALQVEFQNLSAKFLDLLTALGVTIRDDNELADESVLLRCLAPEVSDLIESRIVGSYVTNALVYFLPVRAASVLADVTLSGEQTIDGVALVAGDRFLAKDQTDPAENGIWIVSASTWTRADDLPAAAVAEAGWAVHVREGLLNGKTAWGLLAGTDEALTVGTDDLPFFPVFTSYPVPYSLGGTGATTPAGARTNLVVPSFHRGTLVGDDLTTLYTIEHNLGVQAVHVKVYNQADGTEIMPRIIALSTTEVQIEFVTALETGTTYLYSILG